MKSRRLPPHPNNGCVPTAGWVISVNGATSRPVLRRGLVGFTLVELLVVIAILSLLAALLSPALRQAKDTAYGAVCLSNLRQIHIASLSYAADNNDLLYPVFTDAYGQGAYNSSWLNILGKSLYGTNFSARSSNVQELPAAKIFYCPRKRATEKMAGLGYLDNAKEFSYGANGAYGNGYQGLKYYDSPDSAYDRGTYASLAQFAADTLLVGDCASENSPLLFQGGSINPSLPIDDVRFGWARHNGANFLFVDGHVQRFKPGEAFQRLLTRTQD